MRSPISIERADPISSQARHKVVGLQHLCVNTWMIAGASDVVVVDPNGDPQIIADAVGDRNVIAVICTHGHQRHISGAIDIGVGLCAPVLLHPADHDLWEAAHSRRRYWQLAHGDRIAIAGNEIHIMHTPGHTPGSISLHLPSIGALVSGDAVATRGLHQVGNYSSPTAETLDVLQDLPESTQVYPGHGASFPLASAMRIDHRLSVTSGDHR